MTEQGGSAPAERPGGEPSTERVVIRDSRKIDREAVSSGDTSGEPVTQPESSQPEAAQPEQVGETQRPAEPGEPVESVEPGEPAEPGAEAESAMGDPDLTAAPEAAARQAAELEEDAAVDLAAPAAEDATESALEDATESAPESTAAPAPEDVPADAPVVALDVELEALRAELDERVKDLQRVTAEYANYRKRVDRDRGRVAEQATGTVLAALLPVLDDLDRAREHGDLVGPFGSVAEQFIGALSKFGLTAFGEKGDPFDPTRHEAVAHLTSAEVSEPTCVDVMRRGYLLGDRLLRAALVAVADPES